jgi:hypothetical protein
MDHHELVCDSSASREPRAVPTLFHFRFAHVDDNIRLRSYLRLHSSTSRDCISSTDCVWDHAIRSSFDARESKGGRCLTIRLQRYRLSRSVLLHAPRQPSA